jgi:hypothetical protein
MARRRIQEWSCPRRIGRRIDPATISSSAGIRRHEAQRTAGAPAEVRVEHVGIVPIGSLYTGWALKVDGVMRRWRGIDGKGWLALVDCNQERNRDDPGLVGPVRIADKLYECIAVERTLSGVPSSIRRDRRPAAEGDGAGTIRLAFIHLPHPRLTQFLGRSCSSNPHLEGEIFPSAESHIQNLRTLKRGRSPTKGSPNG